MSIKENTLFSNLGASIGQKLNARISTYFIKLGLMFLMILGFSDLYAQWQPPCQDTTRGNIYFQCNEPYFSPVCGCTEKTYRNECVAYNVYGVNVIKNLGVCEYQNFEFDFYPNPASETINFACEFFGLGNMTLQIFDVYGKLMYFSHRASTHRVDEVIHVSEYKTGLFVINVISGNTFKSKKLIVK